MGLLQKQGSGELRSQARFQNVDGATPWGYDSASRQPHYLSSFIKRAGLPASEKSIMATAREIALEVNALFSLPEAAIRINELVDDPLSGNADIAEVVIHDPGLAARLLKLANSAYYGFTFKVDTVSHAISLLGRQEVRSLALATSVVKSFGKIPEGTIDMEAFWSHSVTCGIVARLLGRCCKAPHGERLFICGLLHGVGKLVLCHRYPERYQMVLKSASPSAIALSATEREIFGFDHAEMSAELLKAWRLPETLWRPIAYYLNALEAPEANIESLYLHVAERIARYIDPHLDVEKQLQEKHSLLENECWKTLKLNDEKLAEIVQEANIQAFEALQIINPNALFIY
jgi:HD-like signal output (HDOD) protein